jgi:hypothetical protein
MPSTVDWYMVDTWTVKLEIATQDHLERTNEDVMAPSPHLGILSVIDQTRTEEKDKIMIGRSLSGDYDDCPA